VQRVAFFGTPEFSARILEQLLQSGLFEFPLVVTQPDKPQGRGKKLLPPPVKKIATIHSLPISQPKSIRKEREQFEATLTTSGPFEGALVVAFGQILPPWLLQYFDGRCVNVHASLLPRWRGAAPIQRAILAGDTQSGICLMKMEEGLDTGPVFVRREIAIDPQTTAGELHDKLCVLGGELLLEHLPEILRGALLPVPQATNGVVYAERIRKEETEIVWSKSSTDLKNLIRGMAPVPGAFTWLQGKRLKVLRGESTEGTNPSPAALAGQVIRKNSESFCVQCGSGNLEVLEVQLEGGKVLRCVDFLRGSSITEGVVLGRG
jgi:methionyl-tRNA formyltransferase